MDLLEESKTDLLFHGCARAHVHPFWTDLTVLQSDDDTSYVKAKYQTEHILRFHVLPFIV